MIRYLIGLGDMPGTLLGHQNEEALGHFMSGTAGPPQLNSARLSLAKLYLLDKAFSSSPSLGASPVAWDLCMLPFSSILFYNKTPFSPRVVHEVHFSSLRSEGSGNRWSRVALVTDDCPLSPLS